MFDPLILVPRISSIIVFHFSSPIKRNFSSQVRSSCFHTFFISPCDWGWINSAKCILLLLALYNWMRLIVPSPWKFYNDDLYISCENAARNIFYREMRFLKIYIPFCLEGVYKGCLKQFARFVVKTLGVSFTSACQRIKEKFFREF